MIRFGSLVGHNITDTKINFTLFFPFFTSAPPNILQHTKKGKLSIGLLKP